VERITGTETITVRGDKIASLQLVPNASDPQTARFLDWARAQATPPPR
jgi:hypothetical protein